MGVETMDETLYNRVDHADGRVEFSPKRAADLDWVPVDGDQYFYISTMGHRSESHWGQDGIDDGRIKFNNVYKTEEQAIKAAPLMSRCNSIIRACLLIDPNFKPNWVAENEYKYGAIYDCKQHLWLVSRCHTTRRQSASVSSERKAEKVCALLTKWGVV
jgi:hypothetical protein